MGMHNTPSDWNGAGLADASVLTGNPPLPQGIPQTPAAPKAGSLMFWESEHTRPPSISGATEHSATCSL